MSTGNPLSTRVGLVVGLVLAQSLFGDGGDRASLTSDPCGFTITLSAEDGPEISFEVKTHGIPGAKVEVRLQSTAAWPRPWTE